MPSQDVIVTASYRVTPLRDVYSGGLRVHSAGLEVGTRSIRYSDGGLGHPIEAVGHPSINNALNGSPVEAVWTHMTNDPAPDGVTDDDDYDPASYDPEGPSECFYSFVGNSHSCSGSAAYTDADGNGNSRKFIDRRGG